MANERPVGKPYSEVCVERGGAVEDSERFRNRLRAHLADLPDGWRQEIAKIVGKKTGATVYFANIAKHFTECPLPDLLSNITHAYTALKGIVYHSGTRPHLPWLLAVDECLRQENIAYVVDRECGLHPAFDVEFDASRQATISLLDEARYQAARQFFDDAMADLKPPHDTRDAVRKTFEAVENVAKLMCPEIDRLGATEVKKYLQPIALEGTTGTERNARSRMIESFAEWVNACQQYRHATGQPEPDAPSLHLAILMVSQGASWLHWLVVLDQATLKT